MTMLRFVKCDGCGKTVELEDAAKAPLDGWARLELKAQWALVRETVELHVCSTDCAARALSSWSVDHPASFARRATA